MAKRCPSCQHPVDDDATACPNCPASWESEDDAAARRANAPQFGLRRLIAPARLAILAAIALFAAGNALYLIVKWQDARDPKPAAPANPDDAIAIIGAGQSGASRLPAALPPAPSAEAAARAPSEAEDSGDADDSGVVLISHDQDAVTASHWRFKGKVVDLVTLKPVGRCRLEFTDPDTARRFETASDAQGRYRVELPPPAGRGYAVLIHADGYAASYLDPATPDAARLAPEDRRDLARNLTHSLAGPYVVSADGDKPVPEDFYLAPEN